MSAPIAGFEEFRAAVRRRLLAARGPHGHWDGELSSSALSTATALFTLALADRTAGSARHADLVTGGLNWLADNQNPDGGWGDTTRSVSNISTTALCWAALGVPEAKGYDGTVSRAENWLQTAAGSLEPAVLAKAIADRYGKDRTFSVPILTMLSLAGRLGPTGWRFVPQLPFELAACPHRWFQWLRLPVVSYALPALIAIGQVRHHHRPTRNPVPRLVRGLARGRTLRTLHAIQPASGGYLEATPLTSFVCMSLIASEQGKSPVVADGIRFLAQSVRPDGSWPIDTNLSTWITTLAVNALLDGPDDSSADFPESQRRVVRDWLLGQQYRTEHPYTHAAPGGWAWTDLPGGVPDADDTAGALLALSRLAPADERTTGAAAAGVRWLLDLQNADGGIPTFCRGWTGLPFDRSSADLTAHALLAWSAWRGRLDTSLQTTIDRAARRGIDYLRRTQRPDGAWAPLWFGNQHAAESENLTYGTSRVLRLSAIKESRESDWARRLRLGQSWLLTSQNHDGGWGGCPGTPSTVEETSLAIEGLVSSGPENELSRPLERALHWLAERTTRGAHFQPEPIGFYFANLWYFDRLYPILFVAGALRAHLDRSD